jgi:hypothetical protein
VKSVTLITGMGLWVAALGIGCSPPEIKPTPDDISVLTAALKKFLALGTASKLPILRTDLRMVPTLTTLLIDPTTVPLDQLMARVLSLVQAWLSEDVAHEAN